MNSSSVPPSRVRSLLRDLSDGLMQQMFLWGCDVRHSSGNLLVKFGMERLPRPEAGSEGSSRYRMPWEGGVIELHGFCAGWYPLRAEAEGVVFVRHEKRIRVAQGPEPVTPGQCSGIGSCEPDALIERTLPFVRWIVSYETAIAAGQDPHYRELCWKDYRRLPGARPWLSPAEALDWLIRFAHAPQTTPRAIPRTAARRGSAGQQTNLHTFAS